MNFRYLSIIELVLLIGFKLLLFLMFHLYSKDMQSTLEQKEYVNHPWIRPNILEYRKYQDEIVSRAVKKSTLVVVPTGLGKTGIAILIAVYRMQKDSKKKILVLAPTKPLVDQHKATFEKFMKLGPEMKAITGAIEPLARTVMY